MIALLLLQSRPAVTWVTVPQPRLDLVGIVLGALGLAGALAVAAVVIGVVVGGAFIAYRRRHAVSVADGTLHLDLTSSPTS